MPGDDNQQQQQQQQQQQAPWYGEFKADAPADFKDWVANKKFADPQTALYSAFNQEKLLGAEKAGRTIVRPKDDKDADGIKAYRTGIGVPEKAADYGVPESMKDDPLWPVVAEVALESGMPKGEFVNFIDKVMAKISAQRETEAAAKDTARKEGLTKLEQAWGANAGKNGELAKRAVGELTKALDPERAKLFAAAVENDPDFRQIFAKVGELMGEHGFSGGDGDSGGSTAAQQQKADELRQKRLKGEVSEQEYHRQMDEIYKPARAA